MKELEKPSIELYMYSLNQEYPIDQQDTYLSLQKMKKEAATKNSDDIRVSLNSKLKDLMKSISSDDGDPDGGTPWDGKVNYHCNRI
jgi:hypothetical protein